MKIGSKIVCIDSYEGRRYKPYRDKGIVLPTKGQVYTIRSWVSDTGLLLNEIKNRTDLVDIVGDTGEPSFHKISFIELSELSFNDVLKRVISVPHLKNIRK